MNLFAWRSKDVRALALVDDPVGAENDLAIDLNTLGMTVWASGPPRKVPPRLRARFTTVMENTRSERRR